MSTQSLAATICFDWMSAVAAVYSTRSEHAGHRTPCVQECREKGNNKIIEPEIANLLISA